MQKAIALKSGTLQQSVIPAHLVITISKCTKLEKSHPSQLFYICAVDMQAPVWLHLDELLNCKVQYEHSANVGICIINGSVR